MKKKPDIGSLRRKADKLFQQWFVERNPKCIVCGGRTSEGHHVVNKSKSNILRYSEDNMVPLCRSCHIKHHFAGDPYVLATIIAKKGQKWFDGIQAKRREDCKLNREYLEEVIKKLTP